MCVAPVFDLPGQHQLPDQPQSQLLVVTGRSKERACYFLLLSFIFQTSSSGWVLSPEKPKSKVKIEFGVILGFELPLLKSIKGFVSAFTLVVPYLAIARTSAAGQSIYD